MPRASSKHYIEYYLYGKNKKVIFDTPAYQLWIPKMLESKTFKDKKFRYIVTSEETKFFTSELQTLGCPDFSIDQIAERFYNSFINAGIGNRPLILICHSMGGLICKKIIEKAKKDDKLVKNIKGIVFYSTPHYGSDVVESLIDIGFKKFSQYLKAFETTSTEYGIFDEEIVKSLSDIGLSRATRDVCLTPRNMFHQDHLNFKNHLLNYICIIETEKTFIRGLGKYVHIVKPESTVLPETENFYLKNKIHSNVQKYSPNDLEDEGYLILSNFIRKSLN
jgi:hypothetical protein